MRCVLFQLLLEIQSEMSEIIDEVKVAPEEWQLKEAEYQKQIENLKRLNEKLINYSEEKSKKFEFDLQKLSNEKEIIEKKLSKMELDELREAATGASNKNIEAFKAKYDGVLRKAQDLLFERTKLVKSLELKVEAQNIQVKKRFLMMTI
jgi:hypothetical protein